MGNRFVVKQQLRYRGERLGHVMVTWMATKDVRLGDQLGKEREA